jgi:hypothetical protein
MTFDVTRSARPAGANTLVAVQISLIVRSGNWERTEVSPAAIAYWPADANNPNPPTRAIARRRPALPLSRLSNRRALEEHDMEQLISRRLPARKAQSGVALIMVLIMLTAMAIAGVALVRVVDSANVISGNFRLPAIDLEHRRSGSRGRHRGADRHSGRRQRKPVASPLRSQCPSKLPLLSCQISRQHAGWQGTANTGQYRCSNPGHPMERERELGCQ